MKKNKKKFFRHIEVDGVPYRYKVGKSNVVIRSDFRSLVIDFAMLFGVSWHEIERAIYKRAFSVTPQHIADAIRKNF